MSNKVSIVGAHGSGKTTITHGVINRLKKEDVAIGTFEEAARQSPYLIAGQFTPETQMDLFGRQIAAEMGAQREYDIVLADRTLADVVMYNHLFYGDTEDATHRAYLDAMDAFLPHYLNTYDIICKTTRLFDPATMDDPKRPQKKQLQREADMRLSQLLGAYGVNFHELSEDTPEDDVVAILREYRLL